ncbi:MAG: Uma2 family endonuclease [Chitinophagaceae bacterium]
MDNEVKEPAPKYNYISPDEYLEMDRASDVKLEYYDGYVQAMSGASLKHADVFYNLNGEIYNFLKGTSCRALGSGMRVATPDRDAYIYPDLLIVCDEPKLEDDKHDTLLNPSVVFEILSPSTHKNDLGHKLRHYQNMPSVKEYIMIDSRKRFAQAVRKEQNGEWKSENMIEQTSILQIKTLGFHLSFEDIYRNSGL